MRIFFIINEAHPLYKIGGLGDVGGSLPVELSKLGVDISIVLPKHPEIDSSQFKIDSSFSIAYGGKNHKVNIYKSKFSNTDIDTYLIEEPEYISQKTDASDNHADKYSVFSLAVSRWIESLKNDSRPDLVHLNDWHTSMIPVILTHKLNISDIKFLTTIHNLMYQGITNTPILNNLGISPSSCQILSMDSFDQHINILLEGLLHSDKINTVSSTYASEILTSEYGEKIDEILKLRKNDIVGILNGLNLETFDPQTDKNLFVNYSPISVTKGKSENKSALIKEVGLEQIEGTLLGFVGRVDAGQKGVQLIIEAIKKNTLINENQQFVFLGTGDQNLEKQLHQASQDRFNIKIFTRYDEELAAKIYAASDLLIIPSKFEPCGLIQMIAMRYGTIPIARSTGGLKDTITHKVDGFLFDNYTTDEMTKSIEEASRIISDPQTKREMIQSAMSKDFSWEQSAKKYKNLYQSIINE